MIHEAHHSHGRKLLIFSHRLFVRPVRSTFQNTKKLLPPGTKGWPSGSLMTPVLIFQYFKFLYRYADSSDCSSEHSAMVGPAEEYLEEESSLSDSNSLATPELTFLLGAFHMFGHFDQTLFLQLCRNIETVHLAAGQFLFRVGDPDENIYVVQHGKVNVHIQEADDRETTIKNVGPGETVTSLLSFIDCLTGKTCSS